MHKITREYEVYPYEELSDEAKETVRNSFGEDSQFETECLPEYFSEQLKEKYPYFSGAEFIWSCSSCQGDGLSFSCDIDLTEFIKAEFPDMKTSIADTLTNELSVSSTGNQGRYTYCSESNIAVSCLPFGDHPKLEEKICEVVQAVKEKYTDVCHEFFVYAENAYQFLYTDEYAKDICGANEYTFLSTGEMFNY